ncbi:MAG TPA: phosphoglycerate dehydrogenase [Chloroflexota bacterium]|nr:phosphoglycerate dehydrogenase [Chloroflexota bacterium]
MPKVLMGRPMAESWIPEYIHKFTDAGWKVVVSEAAAPLSAEDFIADAAGCTAIMANGSDTVSRAVIEAAGDTLKVIARTGVGFDKVDVDAAAEHGVAVTTTPGSNGETVADFTLGLMLAGSRLIPQLDRTLKGGKWDPRKGNDVFGKTVGIAGLGRIGQGVARRAAAFSMVILGYDPYVDATAMAAMGVRKVELDDLLAKSDFITLHMPANLETTGMIDARAIELMKPTVFLVNTARGPLIDEPALLAALKSGWIAGAGLDVFIDEPMGVSPFFELDNVIVSPHIAGNTAESMARMAERAVDNVIAVEAGTCPPEYVVNGV